MFERILLSVVVVLEHSLIWCLVMFGGVSLFRAFWSNLPYRLSDMALLILALIQGGAYLRLIRISRKLGD